MKRFNSYGTIQYERALEASTIEESYDQFEMTFGSPFRKHDLISSSLAAVDVPPELLQLSNLGSQSKPMSAVSMGSVHMRPEKNDISSRYSMQSGIEIE